MSFDSTRSPRALQNARQQKYDTTNSKSKQPRTISWSSQRRSSSWSPCSPVCGVPEIVRTPSCPPPRQWRQHSRSKGSKTHCRNTSCKRRPQRITHCGSQRPTSTTSGASSRPLSQRATTNDVPRRWSPAAPAGRRLWDPALEPLRAAQGGAAEDGRSGNGHALSRRPRAKKRLAAKIRSLPPDLSRKLVRDPQTGTGTFAG
jgi:hypothetical protein